MTRALAIAAVALAVGLGLASQAGAYVYWSAALVGTVGRGNADGTGRANLDGAGVNQSFFNAGNGGAGVAVDALPGRPTLTAAASPSIPAGGVLSATATLAGGVEPSGTIEFSLYGPDDATCAQTPVFTSTVQVTGAGSYGSSAFTPTQVGVYRWTARYSGDGGNLAAQSDCGDSGTAAMVSKLQRALAVMPSAGVVVGAPVDAVATLTEAPSCSLRLRGWGCLTGGAAKAAAPGRTGTIAPAREASATKAAAAAAPEPTGTITFRLYGPGAETCSLPPAFTDAVAVAAEGEHRSGEFVPSRAGVYRWTVVYSGDANNDPVAASCAADPSTQVTVSKATPALSLAASPGVEVGVGPIEATATLSAAHDDGELAFALYGPDDEKCEALPVFSSVAPADGDGEFSSGPFRPALAGVYRWIVTRAGDVNDEAAATDCADAAAAVVVAPEPAPPAPPAPPGPPAPPLDNPSAQNPSAAPGPPPAAAAAPPTPVRPQPAIAGFTLGDRCLRPATNGTVAVVMRLSTARASAVRVEVERALGTRGRDRCSAGGSGRFTGRYRTVANMREVHTQAATATLARRLTLRLRLEPALYRITVRAYTRGGRLSPPKRRFLRVLNPRS